MNKGEWINFRFTREEPLLSFLGKYGFSEVKFPFGTSSFGRYGSGIILWRTDDENLYFLVIPYDSSAIKKILKKDLLLETPKETALRKFKEETNLTADIEDENDFLFEVRSDESREAGTYGVHTKHFFLSGKWRGRVFDFSQREIKHRHPKGTIGTPLWVEANTLLSSSFINGTHREALMKAIEYLSQDIRIKALVCL